MFRQAILYLPLLFTGATAFAQTPPASPAYLVAEFEVIDPAGWQKFAQATSAPVKEHGGEFLSRRNKVYPAAGDPPKEATIIRFPSLEKAQAYLASSEYKALIPNRDKSAKFRSFLVIGGDLAK